MKENSKPGAWPANEWHGVGVDDKGSNSAKQCANQQRADSIWQRVTSVVGQTDTGRSNDDTEHRGKVLQ